MTAADLTKGLVVILSGKILLRQIFVLLVVRFLRLSLGSLIMLVSASRRDVYGLGRRSERLIGRAPLSNSRPYLSSSLMIVGVLILSLLLESLLPQILLVEELFLLLVLLYLSRCRDRQFLTLLIILEFNSLVNMGRAGRSGSLMEGLALSMRPRPLVLVRRLVMLVVERILWLLIRLLRLRVMRQMNL
jgi:hypothetical protein